MLQLATPADRGAVNALALQVHRLHVAWRPDIYADVQELYPEDRFREAVAARELYVAKISDTVVGYVLLTVRMYDLPGLVKRKVMLLDEICVEDAYRHHGIGKQMMEEVKVLARAFGCTDLQLSVSPQNEAALALYESMAMNIKSIQYHLSL